MKKNNLTKNQKENLTDFQAGQMDILNWLERKFNRELGEILNCEPLQLFQETTDNFLILQARVRTCKHYIEEIKALKKTIYIKE